MHKCIVCRTGSYHELAILLLYSACGTSPDYHLCYVLAYLFACIFQNGRASLMDLHFFWETNDWTTSVTTDSATSEWSVTTD